jgi:hypothetical protein
MNKTHRSASQGWAAKFASRALSLGTVAIVLAAIGVACIAAGVWHVASPIETSAVVDSTVMTSLDDVIDDTCRGVARVVRPAIDRTQKFARDPRVAAAILSGDRGQQTEICNRAVVDATEIDALALFDRDGKITAINSKYPSGQLIAPERVDRILGMSFSDRDIVQKCTRDTTDDQALEFQTKCDITPAFFDSSGLSIAYSVAVKDDVTGAKIGVASSRLCFKRLATAIEQHRADLGHYLTQDPKGQKVPDFLSLLASRLAEERGEILDEVARLANKVDHIKTIVAAQHSYAGTSGMIEPVDLAVLLDDAIKMNTSMFERHMVRVEQEYADLPVLLLDKQKLLQILVNLVKNAKEAMVESESGDRRLTIETRFAGSDRFRIIVRDTGVGISPENLSRIFTYGFTTKKTGHGFGLHSCANAAKEMSGSLTAESNGPGTGR